LRKIFLTPGLGSLQAKHTYQLDSQADILQVIKLEPAGGER